MIDQAAKRLQEPKTKKIIAIALVLLLVATIFAVVLSFGGGKMGRYETGSASIDDLLNIRSTLNDPGDSVIFVASDSNPFYALIATPVAAHYGDNLTIHPLLVYQGFEDRYTYTDASSTVNKFLANYDASNDTAIVLGDALTGELGVDLDRAPLMGTPQEISTKFVEMFWSQTDAVILVENSDWGYAEAVNTVPLASYLSIPVIVADRIDVNLANLLESLGVKYTIVCGGVDGYGKTLRHHPDDIDMNKIDTLEEQRRIADYHQPMIADDIIKVIRTRLGGNVDYITLGNPADVKPKAVIMLPGADGDIGTGDDVPEQQVFYNEGIITDSGARAYPGAAPSGNDGPSFTFNIPKEYTFANVIIDMRIDVSEATGPLWSTSIGPIEKNADGSGERMYLYIGMDKDGDGVLDTSETSEEAQFFGGTPGWDMIRENPDLGYSKNNPPHWGWFQIELPFYNEPMEEHLVQLLGRLPTDPDSSAPYDVKITVQNLSDPTYPLMHGLSSMIPYQTAFRKGVVLAKETYQIHTPGFIGCASCGNPAADEDAAFESNKETQVVKNDLNNLLARLAGVDNDPTILAEHYRGLAEDPNTVQYLGIMADPNMVPQYLYPSNGQGDPAEGFGIPSDIAYQDVDADLEDPPFNMEGGDATFELAAGRISGWDIQDVSALIARTVFYDRIIEKYRGPLNTNNPTPTQKSLAPLWKDSAITTIGSEPPISSAFPTTTKMAWMYEQAGFTTNKKPWNLQNEMSRRQYAGEFYESANLIYFCAHGFYYWYVPTAQEGHFGIMAHTGGGGAFDVAHVKDMTFGPSVLFASSCVTGRIDGLPAKNTLSQAFLHGGLNAYVGATRMSWGSLIPIPDDAEGETMGNLMAIYFYGDLTGFVYNKQNTDNDFSGTSVGFALMDAKNKYIAAEGGSDNGGVVSDTYEEFNLLGDPAFVPYVPNLG